MPLIQIKEWRVRGAHQGGDTNRRRNRMSPYLMQPYGLGAMCVAVAFAVTLLLCSITDAMHSEGKDQ